MFFKCSLSPFNISQDLLNRFIKSCYWTYFKKYNILGHHGSGWGFAYIPENSKKLVIKRDSAPIYRADWNSLSKIKTRFLLVHARKSIPWNKAMESLHPINIGEKYLIAHNGTIDKDSFPELSDPKLKKICNNTNHDTRKYLSLLMDELKQNNNLKEVVQSTLNQIKTKSSANAFLFNLNECNVIKHQSNKLQGRHTTLFLYIENKSILISTTPLDSHKKAKEIPNNTLIRINLSNLKTEFLKLSVI